MLAAIESLFCVLWIYGWISTGREVEYRGKNQVVGAVLLFFLWPAVSIRRMP